MNELKNTKLTVAKICHEIANHISVIKFLQEDIKNTNIYELNELMSRIDILTYTMEFFRNIYAATDMLTTVKEPLFNILKLKKIELVDEAELFDRLTASNIENVFLGLLYVVMKSCKQGDTIFITRKDENKIKISVDKHRSLPASIVKAINEKTFDEDIFNVFISYIKSNAESCGLSMSYSYDESSESMEIEVCKK